MARSTNPTSPPPPEQPWDSVLEAWQSQNRLGPATTSSDREPAYGVPRRPLGSKLRERLAEVGISRLYSHQSHAFDVVKSGEDAVIVTGTNSGKSLCYALPTLDTLLEEPFSRAFFLFPTKALAQDQCRKLERLAHGTGIEIASLDGDTPGRQRTAVKNLARVILTNPDMLHYGILPNHDRWVAVLKSLRFVVIDEVHTYRGVFGGHVGLTLRRLLRLAAWHGSRPRVIACSATIGNPVELVRTLTGREAALVDEDGSPQGRRTYAFATFGAEESLAEESANVLTASLLTDLAADGVRTLAFSRSRAGAELVLRYARERAAGRPDLAPGSLESYRAGYTAADRRAIEQRMGDGRILGLSATSALELGVDIGGLDAVVINGFPGTMASFAQQAGRAGRGRRDGLAVFVPHDDPLERFLARQPDRLLGGRNERVVCAADNNLVLGQHLLCAAYERPLAEPEIALFGAMARTVVEDLTASGALHERGGLWFYPSHDPPAARVSLRGIGGRSMRLVSNGAELGTMEEWRARQTAHVGAVYLHRGERYMVTAVDKAGGRVELTPTEVPYYTLPHLRSSLDVRATLEVAAIGRHRLSLVTLHVATELIGFERKALRGGQTLGVEELSAPPHRFDTVGVRLDLEEGLQEDGEGLAAIHGLEHALGSVAPILASCDRGDLSTAWYAVLPDTMRPAVFVYDSVPGGVGLAHALFENRERWLGEALELLTSCPCRDGCPSCLLIAQCPDGNRLLSKEGAIGLLLEANARAGGKPAGPPPVR
ncbi:MAG: DEAD/DEAH box helicase [Fimbriimonadaceae bacterium]|nr:DEAD/DEAH box helicase [Fimbriimonadaceae bacterium]